MTPVRLQTVKSTLKNSPPFTSIPHFRGFFMSHVAKKKKSCGKMMQV